MQMKLNFSVVKPPQPKPLVSAMFKKRPAPEGVDQLEKHVRFTEETLLEE